MSLPRFLLGHNALIGVNHTDRAATGGVKRGLSENDRQLLDAAASIGVEGIVLDDHPVALEAAHYLAERHPGVAIVPMVPYAQGVVDSVSRSGLSGVASSIASTALSMGARQSGGALLDLARGSPRTAGARAGVAHFLRGFPRGKPPMIFLHNAVTDLLLGWRSFAPLQAFAQACRRRGAAPGFVTLNPGSIPALAEAVGEDAWFMAGVNSRGIQMSPAREDAERVLRDPRYQVVAMSVLGGGILDPQVEIPRALSFPAVRSVVIGTSRESNLRTAYGLARRA